MNENRLAKITIALSLIVTIIFAALAFETKDQSWFRVAGGFVAVFTIVCLGKQYFWFPKPSEIIKAPNAFVCRWGGIQAIWSSILVIVGSWPYTF
jgi:hypothetical protein